MIRNGVRWACAGVLLLLASAAWQHTNRAESRMDQGLHQPRLVRAAFQDGGATPAKAPDGAAIYKENCSSCHQADRKGSAPDYPTLIGIDKRYTDRQLSETISQGTTTMLAFPELKPDEVAALVQYLKTADSKAKPATTPPDAAPPSTLSRTRL